MAAQINDVYVSVDLTVYATDRVNGGVYILEPDPALAARVLRAGGRLVVVMMHPSFRGSKAPCPAVTISARERYGPPLSVVSA